jgi:pimeloyl-ACP methyl ester carboxylesterase
VVAWSEVALPAPPIAALPTLLLLATISLVHAGDRKEAYREALGDRLTEVVVPNGHNVLWESPEETISAIERFLAATA